MTQHLCLSQHDMRKKFYETDFKLKISQLSKK